jgi:hypothetical protein
LCLAAYNTNPTALVIGPTTELPERQAKSVATDELDLLV